LIQLVEKQLPSWPTYKYIWRPKRDTTVKILREVLLDPQYGFRKVRLDPANSSIKMIQLSQDVAEERSPTPDPANPGTGGVVLGDVDDDFAGDGDTSKTQNLWFRTILTII
jgi:hypothetical protein